MSNNITEVLPILRSQMSKLKIPNPRDKVFKDECVYSFDSPFSDSGLYVNLISLHGVGERYLAIDANKSRSRVYLYEKWTQVPISAPSSDAMDVEAPTKLAIGVEGGFQTSPKFEIVKEHELVILSDIYQSVQYRIPLPNSQIPEFISNVCNAVISHEGMKSNLAVSTWEADNEKIVSKYAKDLEQINPTNKRIPQDCKQWKDEASDATDNLWLNLSTGYIGGGRRNWDGTGGSGSALQHYIDTDRKYPLVVKLGTITPHGADVWSYADDENCLVIDPNLSDHLSFWGIDSMKLEKTEKSHAEMEVALNMSYDWNKIIEKEEQLVPLSQPGFIGLRNIGSSCYMNSLLQCVLSVPEVIERYFHPHMQIISSSPADGTGIASDIPTQFSKLAHALLSENYVAPLETDATTGAEKTISGSLEEKTSQSQLEKYRLEPRMLKYALAHNHAEFSSGRQQDVSEYYTFLLDQLNRAERVHLNRLLTGNNPSQPSTESIFSFNLEIKFKELEARSSSAKHDVKIINKGPQSLFNLLELPVPLNKAVSLTSTAVDAKATEDPETKRARIEEVNSTENTMIPFEACFESYFEPEMVHMKHPVSQERKVFTKSLAFQSFPRYLVVKLGRYYIAENWTQKKINSEIPMPLELDLSSFAAKGVAHDEEEINESAATSGAALSAAGAAEEFVVDEELVIQLTSMGFSENGCRRAAIATRNADAETAMNWILEHMEDADFNDPPVMPSAAGAGNAVSSALPEVSEESIMMLTAMGYSAEQCRAALIATDNNIERAADWLFSHVDDLDIAVAEVLNRGSANEAAAGSSGPSSSEGPALEQGEGKYTLFAIISHIGKNTDHGHYVCHIYKNGVWALYNDEKVARSEKPPLGHGFMYFYRRNDGPGTFN